MKNQEKLLMDRLYELVGCDYISDLPWITQTDPGAIRSALHQINPHDFTQRQWDDALSYLIRVSGKATVEEAYSCLLAAVTPKCL